VVSLGATRPTIDLQTCRVDHVVADAVCFEQAMKPEAVIARFVARNDLHTPLRFSGNSRSDPLAQVQKLLPIAGLQCVATDFVRQGRVDGNNPTFLA
jgi:hypothetical protein